MDPAVVPYTTFACSASRACSGEGQWRSSFVNEGKEPAIVGLTPNRPAKVRFLPLPLLRFV